MNGNIVQHLFLHRIGHMLQNVALKLQNLVIEFEQIFIQHFKDTCMIKERHPHVFFHLEAKRYMQVTNRSACNLTLSLKVEKNDSAVCYGQNVLNL